MSYEDFGPWNDYAPAPPADAAPPADQRQVPDPAQPLPTNAPTNGAPAESGPAPWAEYASPTDQSTEVGDQMEGGFADTQSDRPLSRLSPEDEAQYSGLLHTGTAPQIRQFLAVRGKGTDEAWLEKFIQARDNRKQHGGKVNYGISYAFPDLHNEDGAVGAAGRGVGRGATFNFLDEAGAVVDALGGTGGRENVWNSDKGFGELYDRNVDYNRAILGADDKDHPYASLGGQLVGGLALPVVGESVGLTRGVSEVAEGAYRTARLEGFTADEARTIAHKTVARRLTTEGAGYGAAYGTGSAEGGPGERLLGAVEGGAEGALAGRALGFVGERMAPALRAARVERRALPAPDLPDALAVAQAAERQGVDILPQDVGGRGIARATQGAAQSPFGAKTVGAAADRLYDSFSGRVGDLAGDAPSPRDAGNIIGDQAAQVGSRSVDAAEQSSGAIERAIAVPGDATGAGQLIQRGVSRFMEDTAERASALYDQVPIPAEQQGELASTRRLLNDFTAEWESNPQLGAIFSNGRLSNFLDALTPNVTRTPTGLLDASGRAITRDVTEGGALSWRDLSEFRTRVGDMLADPNLTEKIAPRQLRALYGALTTDMEATARRASPEALARWKRANNFYDGRLKRINDTFSRVVGKKGDATPNEAFAAVQSMLKPGSTGNSAAFGRIMRSLPAEDANTVRASIVRDARGGRQFDADAFAKNWGQLSERGKSALLPQPGMRMIMDDAAGRAAVDSRNPFAGLSGEQIFAKLDTMAGNKGDATRFQATMARLSPEEANSVRSTFIKQGGRAMPGAQNAEGDAFSIARWLTRWNTMTPEAKAVLFGRGELRASMNDLALLAERVKASEKLAGHSNTGAINDFSKTTMSLGSAVVALLTGHPLVAAGLSLPAAYQRISAEMLTSPRLLRWLTRAPKEADRPGQLAYLSKLSTIAAREPAIANNVIDLREFVRNVISRSPEKAAAQNVDDRRHEEPDQRGADQGQDGAATQREPSAPVVPGNINLHDRPSVRNTDGSISTIRSMSFGTDQGEVLVPTVSDAGRIMSDSQAIAQYQRTGRHLGIFRSPADATKYAGWLHQQQEKEYIR